MKKVLGVSPFGLQDCIAKSDGSFRERGFYLADAVLPTNPFGKIRTGDEAEKERTHTGLHWPPDARIRIGEPLRRAPIPYVWRAFVEAGDRIIRWNVGKGVSFPLSRILAVHVAGLIKEEDAGKNTTQSGLTHSDVREIQPVIAIPNNLDEFGQESLLRELEREGLKNSILVWRPVAAALSWLEKVGEDFPVRMGEDDHIHVVYLGPEAMEFVTFRLRVKEYDNQYYVLPLRDRPKTLPRLTGMDWAGKLIDAEFPDLALGAFWQGFTNFPEIWESLAERALEKEELPRAWSCGERWALWNPSPNLIDRKYHVQAGPCSTLRDLLRSSCKIDFDAESDTEFSVAKVLRKEIQRMAASLPEGRLRGMVICGPLLPDRLPRWMSVGLESLAGRGLNIEGDLSEPEAGSLWLCSKCEDPVADGAAIYGERSLKGIPSYLDTMPQISILAQERGQYAWIPLLNAQEVLGGTEFEDRIEGRFQLNRGLRKLDAYLYKGALESAPIKPEDASDARNLPFDGISCCRARLIREVVRNLGNLDKVRNRAFFRYDSSASRYGLSFAKLLYDNDEKYKEHNESFSEESLKTPFRKAVFEFPSAPPDDSILDVEVRMRPASGLAKVELIPHEDTFLQGKKVKLDYSTMKRAKRLPRRRRGWPRIRELIVEPKDTSLISMEGSVRTFEMLSPSDGNYLNTITSVRDHILKKSVQQFEAGMEFYVGVIDQDGIACTEEGNAIIERIASTFEKFFSYLSGTNSINLMDKTFSRAAWLYTSSPENIKEYLRNILKSSYHPARWRWAVDAASRAFSSNYDIRILLEAIKARAMSNTFNLEPFPIESARAVCRVLMLRKDGAKALDCQMAELLARRALERLSHHRQQHNFSNLYFQLIRLLLYLLRIRRVDPTCFNPDNPSSIRVFEEAIENMEVAENHFKRRGMLNKASQVQSIIEGFEKYLHYEGTEDVLTVLGNLAGEI